MQLAQAEASAAAVHEGGGVGGGLRAPACMPTGNPASTTAPPTDSAGERWTPQPKLHLSQARQGMQRCCHGANHFALNAA